jgi:hypothetical protein
MRHAFICCTKNCSGQQTLLNFDRLSNNSKLRRRLAASAPDEERQP